MGKSTPQAPAAPDPTVVANAQAAANTQTAQEQQRLNMVGTNSPYGTVSWAADPTQPGGYTQTTTLSPGQQTLLDTSTNLQNQAANVGSEQLGRVQEALGKGLTPPTLQGGPAPTSMVFPGQIQNGVAYNNANGNIGPTQGYTNAPQASPEYLRGYDSGGPIQNGIASTEVQNSIGNPNVQTGIGNTQVQRQVGPTDFTQDRNAITDNVWQQALSRLDPMYGQRQNALETRLANQGIGMNSAAYGNAQDIEGRGRNDAYNQALFSAVQQGANEQNTLFNQALQQGNFANQAAGQEFNQGLQQGNFANQAAGQQFNQGLQQGQFANQAADQRFNQGLQQGAFANQAQGQQYAQNQGGAQFANQAAQAQEQRNLNNAQFYNDTGDRQFSQELARGQFGNQAAGQNYAQNLGAAQFANTAQDQGFSQDLSRNDQAFNQQLQAAQFGNQAAQQGFQNQSFAQSQPINNLSALLGLTQVQGPQGINYTPTQVGNTDVIGANAISSQARQAAYNSQMQMQGGLLGGLSQLGSAAIIASDIRLKEDIRQVGRLDNGLPVYAYRYKGSPATQIGVMAQEVLNVHPEAVRDIGGGYLGVDYARAVA